MLKLLQKLFGNKQDKDAKELRPYVTKILAEYVKLRNISDDELRGRSDIFRQRIQNHIKEVSAEIAAKKKQAETTEDLVASERMYEEAEKLRKKRNEQVEQVLMEILPEAFAVVKETARRLSENKALTVTATDWDHKMAQNKPNVVIEGDKAIWKNKWLAAGGEIEWNMVHYDVQLMGGVVLHTGKISEMATGEGKTLVATLPVYLNALTGMGVHLVTVNDYLARRDCEWNGPLFQFHKISVDCIDFHEPNSDERRQAYLADVTYGTNNEFGFDYLRDNMTTNPDFLVQREHHYGIVDEIDSVLIDEARTPLIISGPVPRGDIQEFNQLKPRVEKLMRNQQRMVTTLIAEGKKAMESGDKESVKEAGLKLFRAHRGLPRYKALVKYLSEPGIKSEMLKTEGYYLQDKGKNMHIVDDELYFTIDEKNNQVELTEKGRELITGEGEDSDLFVMPDVASRLHEIDGSKELTDEEKLRQKDLLAREFAEKSDRLHTINQLVKAYTLFERDIEYIVDEGKVKIVDEQTGRVLPGRRYSDGLHQAIEAKENVTVEAATQTFATVTLQNFFRMYHKLSGMTGTAETEAAEFFQIYKLDVVVVPTNRAIVRKDDEDFVYKTKREKYNAVIDEIEKLRQAGRPVLVGTTSVEVSELLSRMLRVRKIEHNVLNAKQHQREAEIVAAAGLAGNITIATNMAGRGTDIKLGPNVKQSGGLAIIGTERHESRRIDRQLRGRAGRQGDPGSSQFYVSLEDDLMRLFGSERISRIMDRIGIKEGEVIQHSMITKSITNAQKKVEENNFAMRKRLLEYDDVMNSQREVIYRRRRNALFGDRMRLDLDTMLWDVCAKLAAEYYEISDYEGLQFATIRMLSFDPEISEKEFNKLNQEALADRLYDAAKSFYKRKTTHLSAVTLQGLQSIRDREARVEMVDIPFSDGTRKMRIVVNLDQALATKGEDVPRTLERSVMLHVIDDKWKNHLREMDELRTAVQNAVYEQKDPLVAYKFEAYQLFQEALGQVNEQVISMIFKADLDIQGDREEKVQESRVHRDDFSKMKANHGANLEAQRREAAKGLSTSGPSEPAERPLTRAERRIQDRKGPKR
ncbi:MAG: preprotein translocase subunit SecA [Bacteroidetes bacterium]|nr:preprotein translocase subunit SecA [Bacteroidota bacterium]MBL0016007.1 preprotein translocase subunit SecA [Bacteroidota bacterium]